MHLTKKMKSLSSVCHPQSCARVKHKLKDKSKYLTEVIRIAKSDPFTIQSFLDTLKY